MRLKEFDYFMCDFETTVFEGQDYTEVWAAAIVPFYTEDVKIFHSIGDFFQHIFKSIPGNIVLYFHNLKFDGMFILSYLLETLHWREALTSDSDVSKLSAEWMPEYKMKNKTFKYMISERGAFYTIILKQGKRFIEIRDSLKLLPFSVKELGKSFDTKHKKLDMVYKGFRYAGCNITEKEKEYIKNDVLVVKEALEICFQEGHNKLTIGSCCFNEFRRIIGRRQYDKYFPDLTTFALDVKIYGADNADKYIRRAYKGGWCYLVPEKANKIYKDGLTIDVNSLYPFVMSGESGFIYPIGEPEFFSGPEIPQEALQENRYFYVRFQCQFFLKDGFLPTVQIKNNFLYKSTEWLETSLIRYKDSYYSEYTDLNGIKHDATVILTMTQTDYFQFITHYNVKDLKILDGCFFHTAFGLFDDYINKYKQIKQESTGAKRTLAKLFLNNLYGRMAQSNNSSWKFAFIKDDDTIGFLPIAEFKKRVAYIPIGAAITSYARNYTISAAQANYYGKEKPGFIYADTDSIHCDLKPDELKGINLDSKKFGFWDLERQWQEGLFVRQKTYIEIKDDDYNIKCAGLQEHSKRLLQISISGKSKKDEIKELPENEKKFALTKRELADFKRGLKIPGKLIPKQINGGVVLVDTEFQIR